MHHGRARYLFAFLFLIAGSIAAGPVFADVVYMQIPTITGEVTEATHVNWIQAYSLDHGGVVQVQPGGGGPTFGNPELSQITILKGADKSTPALHDALVRHTVFTSGPTFIEVCRTSPSLQCYYRIELINTTIVGDHLAGNSCIDPSSCTPNVVESVDLYFTKIKWRYTPFTSGKAGTPIEKCWDVVSGTTSCS